MNQVAEFRGRGIQESDVFAAADALLAEGKRPTIERVRGKIGRGSPNTVSPMIERWFATLGERLAGTQARSGTATGNDAGGMPPGVRNAAKLLWETARREAGEIQRGELASARSELQAREDALAETQATLAQREDAFAQARVSLDAALASSQQTREALERQLREHAIEAHRVRTGLEDEIRRLTALLAQAAEAQEQMRHEHAATVAAKDRDLRQAEARHGVHEKRMLAEIDRARQAAKTLQAELTKEQHRRLQGEEAAAKRLEGERGKLARVREEAREAEAALRNRLAEQSVELAQTRASAGSAKTAIDALKQRVDEEKASHEATRRLLADALQRIARTNDQAPAPRAKRPRSSK